MSVQEAQRPKFRSVVPHRRAILTTQPTKGLTGRRMLEKAQPNRLFLCAKVICAALETMP